MSSIQLEDLQRNPTEWIRRVQAGETLVLLQANRPIAEIKPIAPKASPRPFGLCAGEFTVPDDFNDPLPDKILGEFEGR